MTDAVIARRRSEREAKIEMARQWAKRVAPVLHASAIVVVGSVARGDFNKWSDIDVLIIADQLPAKLHDRLSLLAPTGRPPGVEAILWTASELATRKAKGNDPIARDAYEVGVAVHGQLPD